MQPQRTAPIIAVPQLTPEQQIGAIITLGLAHLLPDIAAAAEHRGQMAVQRGDPDHAADYWFRLQEAADDVMVHAQTVDRRVVVGECG